MRGHGYVIYADKTSGLTKHTGWVFDRFFFGDPVTSLYSTKQNWNEFRTIKGYPRNYL